MSRHSEQLAATIRRAVQDVLARGLHDPRVSGLITVTEVRLPEDLSRAVVCVSVYPEERQHLTLKGLADAARHIRHEVGELISTRRMPELAFELDTRLKKQAEVLKALSLVDQERAGRPPAGDRPSAPDRSEGNPTEADAT